MSTGTERARAAATAKRSMGKAEDAARRRAVLIEPDAADMMQEHLWSDMKHDHGNLSVLPQSSTLITDDTDIAKQLFESAKNEDQISDYFRASFPAQDAELRKSNIITFNIDNTTSLFPAKQDPIFTPFNGVPNDQVGIVQDAGVVLYKVIGAKNLITFGSVLDQAGKPKEDAVFVNVGAAKTYTFPASKFGFNPRHVTDINISKFTGGSVVCKFGYKYEDKPLQYGGTPDAGLKLNEIGGDFQSVATVKSLTGENKYRAFIGKALGDALQVESLVPGNPFLPGLPVPVTPLGGTEPSSEIQRVLMNTGDRLNHIRAYAFGVGSVYSAPAKFGVRTCEFIPGVELEQTTSGLFNMYNTRILSIIQNADKAYEDLSLHIAALAANFTQDNSMKAGEALIPGPTEIERIKNIHVLLRIIVESIRTFVMGYFLEELKVISGVTAETATEENIQQMKEIYQKLLTDANGLIPSHTSTMRVKGGNSVIEAITLCKYGGVVFGSDSPLTATRKKEIDGGMASKWPVRTPMVFPEVYFPEVTIPGGIKGTLVFYVSNVYQLVGKRGVIGAPYNKLFTVVNVAGVDPETLLRGDGAVVRKVGEIFGQQFSHSTDLNLTVGGMVGGQAQIRDEPDNDVLKLFLQEAANIQKDGYLVLQHAFGTYLRNPFSILDDVLFKELYGATIANFGEAAQTAFDGMESAVRTLVLMKTDRPGPTTRSMAAKRRAEERESYKIHSYATLFVNEFSMLYNASIVAAAGTDSDNDYYAELIKYHDEFKSMREGVDNLIYFFENPVAGGDRTLADTSFVKHVGGQRVARENWNIDLTKSFVKSVGASPS